MKVAVIGCTHTGTAAINELRNLDKNIEITVYERNDTVSFLSCGIALVVGKFVPDINDLFYQTVEDLESKNIKMNMKHEVTKLDIKNKKLIAKDLKTNKEIEDTFDKLIVSTGSIPFQPNIKNSNLENVFIAKNFYDANNIISRMDNAKEVTVVGAGYIGIELVEAFHNLGKKVNLVDLSPRIMEKYADKDVTDKIEKTLKEKGINLHLGQTVKELKGDKKLEKIITDKTEIKSDTLILCIGFRPNNDLIDGQLKQLDNKAIVVDSNMKTSNNDVYAGGDSVCLDYLPDNTKSYLPLATNAIRTGTIIARSIAGIKDSHPGTNATSAIKIFNHNLSTTGLTLEVAKKKGINAEVISVSDSNMLEFFPEAKPVELKVVYNKDTEMIIGAQILSDIVQPQMINIFSVCIHKQTKIEELAYMDFYFLPHYNKPWNIINLVGLEYKANKIKK